ncbi:MAG: hypothetical protein BWY71_02260 [Planctomycetes bacterium ADurb.Bin412]|nr:MAG: hypothetical protein BWY71_02260 [Planctomycetes bacterium ADurb.Bin412]
MGLEIHFQNIFPLFQLSGHLKPVRNEHIVRAADLHTVQPNRSKGIHTLTLQHLPATGKIRRAFKFFAVAPIIILHPLALLGLVPPKWIGNYFFPDQINMNLARNPGIQSNFFFCGIPITAYLPYTIQ